MNYKKHILQLLLLTIIVSCNSIKVNKSVMHTATTAPVALGVIGMQHNKITYSDFKETAIPSYKKGIRLGVTTSTFNKDTYRAYLGHSESNKQNIVFIDSLKTKPSFLQLEILDRVTLLSELKKEENATTIAHIKNHEDVGVVTSVSVALSNSLLKELMDAEAVFLTNTNYKQYQLSLVRDGKSYKAIDISEATIFGYQLSYFCWGINGKRRVTLLDIIDEKSSCPKKTHKNAEKVKEKIDYFKL